MISVCFKAVSLPKSRGPLSVPDMLSELIVVSHSLNCGFEQGSEMPRKFIKVENSRITRKRIKRRCSLYCSCRNTVVIFFWAQVLFWGSGSWQDNRRACAGLSLLIPFQRVTHEIQRSLPRSRKGLEWVFGLISWQQKLHYFWAGTANREMENSIIIMDFHIKRFLTEWCFWNETCLSTYLSETKH